ncbi:acyl-CoA dehydrogenase family protein [Tumidithrix elongata RA019]|uniref:Dibenzothiophene monooxygenase n=1 Tax=Tumidithrix elongata BACA0141 TaxID=2716417 RepID=A0AAW9Q3C9_9CYAN|nr:acyl-CoA dehydrogenase family protein [Tumidithrix elongata RA019]
MGISLSDSKNSSQQESRQDYLAIAKALAQEFAATAIERDRLGGTPKAERDRIRASGLLGLIVPKEYGGIGETWITAFQISRELAKADSSLAHVYSYHHLGVVIPYLFGTEERKAQYYTDTVRNNWFWCNALNPLDRRATLTPDGTGFLLNGIKSFCSGSKDSDILPITAVREDTSELTILVIPTQREGVQIHDDWDNIGQRQTDSGSISFNQVRVDGSEVFGARTQVDIPFRSLRACLTQLNLAHIYLGIAEGAFAAAKDYTRNQARPWLTSNAPSAAEDPYILKHYGEIWVDLQAVGSLTDKAALILQAAWQKGTELTAEERGQCAIAIATAKVAASKTGLEVTNRIFEVMGARATTSKYGFDRYWRNLRTFTLHDSVDYKIQDLGNWALNDRLPNPSFYA